MSKLPFKKVLIANRGEIALRVIRAARELSLKTVAVYSDADKNNAHVLFADEAVHIGEAEAKKSYLDPEKILAACKKQAPTPFTPALVFSPRTPTLPVCAKKRESLSLDPRPEAIDLMGDKLAARDAMKKAGVPFVPGSDGALASLAEAKAVAAKIGFPVILKAAAGGGGKGMRIATSMQELEQNFELVQREAKNYFGDDSVFLERFAKDPHHIEVQIIAEQHGSTFATCLSVSAPCNVVTKK